MSDYACGPAYGGETLQIATEALSANLTTTCTIDSTAARINTGARCLKFPLSASGASYLRAVDSTVTQTNLQTAISFFTGFFGVSAQPNAGQLTLLGDGTVDTGVRLARVGDTGASDTKLRIYTGGGGLKGTSVGSISTTGKTEVMICVDCLSIATVFIHIFIAGVWDSSFDTGVSPATFWSNGAGTVTWGSNVTAGQGADLFGDDFTMRYTTNKLLAPHLVGFPRYHVFGGMQFAPTKEGAYIEWASNNAPNPEFNTPVTYTNIDATDITDVTRLVASVLNKRHLFHWGDNTTAFPNPITDTTIDAVFSTWIHKLVAGGKTDNIGLFRLGGTDVTYNRATAPSTSYVGNAGNSAAPVWDYARPGGGLWTPTDFEMESGTSTSVDATHMTDTGANWDVNGLSGRALICGASTATITSNTATVILHGGWTGGTPGGVSAYIIACSRLQFGIQSAGSGTISVVCTYVPGPIVTAFTNRLPLAPWPGLNAALMAPTSQPIFLRTGVVAY